MLRKLYALVSGSCSPDNPDSPQHQEVLMPGSLYGMIIKERMEEILNAIRLNISIDVRNGASVDFNDSEFAAGRPSLVAHLLLQRNTLQRSSLASTSTLARNFPISLLLVIWYRRQVSISNKPLVSPSSPKSSTGIATSVTSGVSIVALSSQS